MVEHFPLLGFTALLFAATPLAAQKAPEPPPERMVSLLVFGNDPCPRSSDREIVVCARLPENERYRIPKRLRGKKAEPPQESWANRAHALEYVSRIGTPNSCSPVGSAGQTGCYQQFLRIAREERRQAKAEAGNVP
jgi:hypothetical protein